MKLWVISWRYMDGSSSGVMETAYESEEMARHVYDMLEKEATMKQFSIQELNVMEASQKKHDVAKFQSPEDQSGTPLWELCLTARAENILNINDIYTVEKLLLCSEFDLMKMPGMGKKSIDVIKESLASRKLRLA